MTLVLQCTGQATTTVLRRGLYCSLPKKKSGEPTTKKWLQLSEQPFPARATDASDQSGSSRFGSVWARPIVTRDLELTRFHGHLILGKEGVHHAEVSRPIRA